MTHPNAAIAEAWLHAFNARDLEALLALYAEDCTHTSPKIRTRHPDTHGKLVGKSALRAWWADAFERLPELRYEKLTVTADDAHVVLEYVRHAEDMAPMPIAELFAIEDGSIIASRVYHG